MAILCKHFGYTPAQVRELSLADANTLMEYLQGGQ